MSKKIVFALFFLSTISSFSYAQQSAIDDVPNIEITGTAQMEIIPDEIYISITLRERTEGRDQITIDKQEIDLKNGLKAINVSLDSLFLSDTESDYIKVNWGKHDVVTSKKFILKVATADVVGNVFKKLDELKIQDAYIERVNHSKLVEFKKQMRIEAIQAAKEKADYLLNAIDQETGRALIVRENSPMVYGNYNQMNYRLNEVQTVSMKSDSEQTDLSVQFQKIKIEASIYVKFEIK